MRIIFISIDINYQQSYISFQCSPLNKDRQVGPISHSTLDAYQKYEGTVYSQVLVGEVDYRFPFFLSGNS